MRKQGTLPMDITQALMSAEYFESLALLQMTRALLRFYVASRRRWGAPKDGAFGFGSVWEDGLRARKR